MPEPFERILPRSMSKALPPSSDVSASAEPAPDKPGDSYVQSFARGLAVIRAFDAKRPEQTLTDVAAATGLTRGARAAFC